MFRNGNAVPTAWYNSVQRRLNGIVDFDPMAHGYGEGPCAVSIHSSGTSIQLDITGGDVQVGATVYERSPTTQGLADNTGVPEGFDEPQPRRDVLTVAEGGSVVVHEGAPDSNLFWHFDGDGDPTGSRPEGRDAPLPEGNDTATVTGTLLADVYVPAGANDSHDLSAGHIRDLRRPAIRPRRDPEQEPNVHAPLTSADTEYDHLEPISVPPGYTLKLYSVRQIHPWTWDPNWNIQIQLAELQQDPIDTETMNIVDRYATAEESAGGDPLHEETVADDAAEPGRFALRQTNLGDEEFAMPNQGIGFEAAYRKDPTESF